jgi:hypothetical protein
MEREIGALVMQLEAERPKGMGDSKDGLGKDLEHEMLMQNRVMRGRAEPYFFRGASRGNGEIQAFRGLVDLYDVQRQAPFTPSARWCLAARLPE